mmetsp:Transcript_39342/g.81696  ORF Transcript_39342/g.81696 Transcript_39342/m.81696 type:complete len:97 (+) Transcript_39342:67-357(+)|eukprot:CAMPEP_0172453164 /NCGR_PEP_ID=MMETSP1065-20121228/10611_1 /TAXON_ID=265537 /ORGANISM="Amphiprora paludosa, Strain CCMP125" /LENGTH=96 /DNA_ID=CAMNT_0013205337 /DNA_START=64 /DNA_END=354 /DNA_ORIENTATION=-
MSRGDQRERDRAKAQAKQAEKTKANGKSGNPLSRNLNDASALQAKVAAKQEKLKSEQANAGNDGKAPVVRKKTQKKNDSVDDLLSAGLAGNKKRAK